MFFCIAAVFASYFDHKCCKHFYAHRSECPYFVVALFVYMAAEKSVTFLLLKGMFGTLCATVYKLLILLTRTDI